MTYHPGEPCPCGIEGCTGSRLSAATGHVTRNCLCRSCMGRRNRAKGQRAQRRTHHALGGLGITPSHEESGLFYEITVRPEVKTGQQIPASWRKFISLDWTRRAISQASRSIPAGVDARAGLCIDGRWLVVDLDDRGVVVTP